MSHLDYGIFDCDTHCYEPRDAFTRYLPEEYLDRAIAPVRQRQRRGDRSSPAAGSPPSTASRASASTWPTAPARSRRCSSRWRRATPRRPTSPSRCGPSTSSASRAWRCSTTQGVERCVLFPAGMALAAEHYVARHRRALRQPRVVQPLVRRDLGLQLPGPASTPPRCCRCATSTGPSPLTDDILARGAKVVLLPTGPAYGRSPGRPVLRPGLVAPRRGRRHGRVPHHAVLVLRRHLAGVGPRPRPGRRGTCRRGSG